MLGTLTPNTAPERAHLAGQRGLSFVELLVVLVVLAVLAAVAVPSMRDLIARKRVESIGRELVTDLKLLRSQATHRTRPVVIQFGSNNDVTCYVLYGFGEGSAGCDCARTDGLPSCGDPAVVGASEEFKTVLVRKDRRVLLSSVPQRLTLEGFSGLPRNDAFTGAATRWLQAKVLGSPIGGEVRVYTTEVDQLTPRLCSVSGHESAMPHCPP